MKAKTRWEDGKEEPERGGEATSPSGDEKSQQRTRWGRTTALKRPAGWREQGSGEEYDLSLCPHWVCTNPGSHSPRVRLRWLAQAPISQARVPSAWGPSNNPATSMNFTFWMSLGPGNFIFINWSHGNYRASQECLSIHRQIFLTLLLIKKI